MATNREQCDSCIQEMRVRVVKVIESETLIVQLCKHHYERFQAMLTARGWRVVRDDRARLEAKP